MKLLEMLRGSKAGEKIVAEVLATTYDARKKLADERDRLRTDGDRELAPLIAARDVAREARERADKIASAARAAETQAEIALSTHGTSIEYSCAHIDRELERGADPRITAFALELEGELQRFRQRSTTMLVSINAKPSAHDLAWRQAQRDHGEGLRQAVQDARALRTLAQTESELREAMAAIRARIPSAHRAAAAA